MKKFLLKKLVLIALALAPLFSAYALASTPEPPAVPRDYVVDLAGVVSADMQQRMNALLQELERKTGSQVLVLTVQSLDGQSIEEFSFDTKEKWRLGQKGKDNGVLLVVAVRDRRYRFEIGYGLEAILPDSYVGTLGREYLVPYFRKGDYGSGIYAATLAVASTIAQQEGVELTGIEPLRQANGDYGARPAGRLNNLIAGVFIFVSLILFITHPRQCFLILLMSNMGSGRSGWSGGGGGFGGGSFGGGGGGSGGGGGASGGW